MIPTDTFNFLMIVAFAMLVYALWDNRNHMYSNIVISALAGITFQFLGTAAAVGAVTFTAASLGDILKMFGWVALGYAAFMAADVIFSSQEESETMQKAKQDSEESP